MDLPAAWERFYFAVRDLAQGTGPLPERVTGVFHSHLYCLLPNDVPPEIAKTIETIREGLTMGPTDGVEGPIAATARQMTDEEAKSWADAIVTAFVRIVEHCAKTGAIPPISECIEE